MTRINSDAANAGFPFKLGEFLATGKAVIASDVGDVSSYLKNNIDSILIKPNNVDELVVALSYILDNPEKISSLGNEARNTAETYFDSEKVSTKVLELFKRI
jgi:glycosyltransferase involved in cell wall biosynthesis